MARDFEPFVDVVHLNNVTLQEALPRRGDFVRGTCNGRSRSELADYVEEDVEIADFGVQMTVVRLRNGVDQLLITGSCLNRDGVTGQDGASGESEDEPLFYGVAAKVSGIEQSNADLFECAPVAIGLLNLKMQIIEGNDTFGK